MINPCSKCERKYDRYGEESLFNCGLYIRNECISRNKYDIYLEKKRKYKKGNIKLNTIDEVLSEKAVWFIFGVKNREFVENMRVKTLLEHIKSGIYNAELNKKE